MKTLNDLLLYFKIVSPVTPLNINEALATLKEICLSETPDIIVGT